MDYNFEFWGYPRMQIVPESSELRGKTHFFCILGTPIFKKSSPYDQNVHHDSRDAQDRIDDDVAFVFFLC